LASPRSSEHATFAGRHVGFYPRRDGVVKGECRLFGVLDGVGEEASLGEEHQLLELRCWHLEVLRRDALQVVGCVQLSLGLSDDTTDGLSEPWEVDGVEHKQRSIGLTRHDKLGLVERGAGGVGFVGHGVEHDEDLLGRWAELQAVCRQDGVVSVVGDVTAAFERHALHLSSEVVDVSERRLSPAEGHHVGGFVHAVSAESDEGVTDVEFALGAEVLVQVQHGGCDASFHWVHVFVLGNHDDNIDHLGGFLDPFFVDGSSFLHHAFVGLWNPDSLCSEEGVVSSNNRAVSFLVVLLAFGVSNTGFHEWFRVSSREELLEGRGC